ncbi:hypothetical protein M409DRAFT_21304 [Zasmidium cellare ATCC 36951]|uniref:Gfo/Idh/MocA-like oxidoreductase N-terminal domain-containing protein n=1 Tax=Zasmidium cellare ATCC 36951 TaxID=1080233 RepID=A0A6A6CPF4_ZASCE|nr:uncharacterized protein M409DRAFT_21304 [Zasmidium cellare ATCC 36951]KAF2168553.1 hypothetical protein M409DRAFT_21304 [Zasmidium cellare ATCC 36951]
MVTRVGIIGLSASDGTWAAGAHANPLKTLPLSDKYALKAVSTSSAASAAKSAERWGIASDKAYSSAEDIAKDPDVDLVVVSVKLPQHRDLTLPLLKAGKDVFVEWPLATNLEQIDELLKAAKEGGGKTYVGLQARTSPAILKAKEIIDSGALGKIRSSTIVGLDSFLLHLPPQHDYEHDASTRANASTITSGHVLDAQAFLLGEYEHLTAQHDCFFKTVTTPHHDHPVSRDAPDSFLVQGKLQSGAVASFSLILTTPGSPSSFSWTIAGDKGALKLEGPNINIQMVSPMVYFASNPNFSMEDYLGGKTLEWEEVAVPKTKTANNTGDLYLAIADRKNAVEGSVVDFERAALRHRMLEAGMKSGREGTIEKYL